MSEFLSGDKQEELKRIIRKLHDGAEVKEVKKDFHRLIQGVSPEEIASMEQALIDEGFPAEEVQRLCDVHVEVFEASLEKQKCPKNLPGHPVHTFKLENRAVKPRLKACRRAARIHARRKTAASREALRAALADLRQYEIHYQRKENQLFPYLEQYNFTGPSKVMWGKHDEIRGVWRQMESALDGDDPALPRRLARELSGRIRRMIFMEEKILYPTAMKKLTDRDWAHIRRGEAEIGYAWIKPGNVWDAGIVLAKSMQETVASWPETKPAAEPQSPPSGIPLTEGALSPEQINLLLLHLPVDVTYVDENDRVCYYTGSEHRVFPRSPAIIGRSVQNCHPPGSVHIVEEILAAFRNKEKESAEFWIRMGEMFVHIRYFAMYDADGAYRGCLEVSQDVAGIRALEGERRLLDW